MEGEYALACWRDDDGINALVMEFPKGELKDATDTNPAAQASEKRELEENFILIMVRMAKCC